VVADRSGASRTASHRPTKSDDAHLLAERAPGLLARLQVLTGALAGALSETDVARVLVDHGVEGLGAAAGLVVIDGGEGSLTIAASRGYPEELMERWRDIPGDAPVPVADSIRTARPVFILSLEERDRMYPALANEEAANSAFLVVPFVLEDRALGALALSFAEPSRLLEIDKTFVLAIAQQAAVSLERARLYDAEKRARRDAERANLRQRFLARTTEVLSSTLDMNDLLAQLARSAVPTLADWCIVYLADGRGGVRRIALEPSDPERGELIEKIRTSFAVDGSGGSGLARVLRSGEVAFHPKATAALLAADVHDPATLAALLEPIGISSWMCVPIVHGGDILGAISFVGSGDREYTLAEVELAEDVARGAGLAIENARLMEGERSARAQAEKVRDRLSFLSEVSGLLAKSLDHLDAIAELGALAVGRIADWCAIDLVTEAGAIDRVVARHADPVATTPVEDHSVDWPIDPDLPVGSPAVIRSGRAELYPEIPETFADHISQDPTELKILRSIGITSAMIVPIQARGRTLGAMTLVSTREDRRYDSDDLDFATLVALRAGVATDNARLYSAARRSDEDSRFQRLLLESQSEATIDGIRVVSADGHILFVNQRWRDMWGYGDEELVGVHEDDVLRRVLELIEDPEPFVGRVRWLYDHPEESARDEVRLKDGRVFDRWSAPLITEGVTYGRAWYQRDVTAERQLEERLTIAERRSALLADVSALLAAARDERTLFDGLVSELVPFLADWCIVDIVQNDGTYDRVAVAHRDPEMGELASRVMIRRHYAVDPDAVRGVPKVLRTGMTEHAFAIPSSWIDEVGTKDPEYIETLKGLGFRSYIVVPLIARGRVLGAITVLTAGSGRTYAADDVTLAEEVARRASIALENVRLLAERSATARSLQESLLPPALPMIPGVALASRFRAAGDGNEVGGDFYDVFPAASGGWALVVGDVCGKGPEAAALTALVRYTIRTLSMQIRKPRRILARLNDAILSQRSDGRFCTLAYARLDIDAQDSISLRLASGGHPLPVLIRRDGEVHLIGRTGTLLGVFADARSPERSVALEPGDAVLFYTDGVIEARSGSDVFGESRLLEILRSCGGVDASDIAQRVDQAVRDFQDGDQRDDIAVLVVQAVAPSP
jgi:PAS domain S-box-containing protein